MTVDREFVSPKGVVKGIGEMCQLVGRYDVHWEDERNILEV